MRKTVLFIFLSLLNPLFAENPKSIVLTAPDTVRGLPVMNALLKRASTREWSSTDLSLKDMSDLLWAANGINRPDSGKRTAPSAMNAQDIDIYVFMKSAVYLYNAKKHILELAVEGDHRDLIAGKQENVANAPVICLLVSDTSRFKFGEASLKQIWAAEDAGIVSQNISIFCASVGLATRPRASMEQEKLRKLLKLKASQLIMLNNPVSYVPGEK